MVKAISRAHNKWYATDGTITLNYGATCMPADTDFTSVTKQAVGHYSEIIVHTKCDTNVTIAMAFKVEISADGINWKDSTVTFTSLDTTVEEWKEITDKGIQYLRVNLNNTNAAETAKVFVVISCKA